MNRLHSLCKDCVRTELSQEIFLCIPPTPPPNFPPNSQTVVRDASMHQGTEPVGLGILSSTVRRSLHGLFALEVFALNPLFPSPPGFVRFSGSPLPSVSVCVHSHLSAQLFRLMALEHHSAGHFLCEKSEAFCQEKKNNVFWKLHY